MKLLTSGFCPRDTQKPVQGLIDYCHVVVPTENLKYDHHTRVKLSVQSCDS